MAISRDDEAVEVSRSNRRRTIILITVIALHLLAINVSVFFFSNWDPNYSDSIYLSVFFAQATLLGVWAALGRLLWIYRLIVSVFGVLLLTSHFVFLANERYDPSLAVAIGIVVTFPFLVVFTATWSLRMIVGLKWDTREPRATDRREVQFSIRHMMILTLAFAILLGLARLIQWVAPATYVLIDVVVIGGVIALCSLVTIWASYGNRMFIPRILFAVTVSCGGGYVIPYSMDQPGIDIDHIILWVLISGLQAVILLSTLLAMRMAGFSLTTNRSAA